MEFSYSIPNAAAILAERLLLYHELATVVAELIMLVAADENGLIVSDDV